MREALETISQRCASYAGEAPAALRRIAEDALAGVLVSFQDEYVELSDEERMAVLKSAAACGANRTDVRLFRDSKYIERPALRAGWRAAKTSWRSLSTLSS